MRLRPLRCLLLVSSLFAIGLALGQCWPRVAAASPDIAAIMAPACLHDHGK